MKQQFPQSIRTPALFLIAATALAAQAAGGLRSVSKIDFSNSLEQAVKRIPPLIDFSLQNTAKPTFPVHASVMDIVSELSYKAPAPSPLAEIPPEGPATVEKIVREFDNPLIRRFLTAKDKTPKWVFKLGHKAEVNTNIPIAARPEYFLPGAQDRMFRTQTLYPKSSYPLIR